jgi:predicted ATPase
MGRAQAGETWPLNLSRIDDELDAKINDAAVRTVLRYAKRARLKLIGDDDDNSTVTSICARLGLDLGAALERAALPAPGAVERLEPLQPYPSGPLVV